MPVDLPLGQHLRRARVRRRPSRRTSAAGRARRATLRPLLERALELLLPHRDVEAGLAQRGAERAERVPVERLRRDPAAPLVEVACGRRAAELLAERRAAPRAAPRGSRSGAARARRRAWRRSRCRSARSPSAGAPSSRDRPRTPSSSASGRRARRARAAPRGSARPSSACGSRVWNDASSSGSIPSIAS